MAQRRTDFRFGHLKAGFWQIRMIEPLGKMGERRVSATANLCQDFGYGCCNFWRRLVMAVQFVFPALKGFVAEVDHFHGRATLR